MQRVKKVLFRTITLSFLNLTKNKCDCLMLEKLLVSFKQMLKGNTVFKEVTPSWNVDVLFSKNRRYF